MKEMYKKSGMPPKKPVVNRHRRGLSTIVGTIIFVILLVSGFSSMVVALNYQSDLIKNLNVLADKEKQRITEKLSLGVSTQVIGATPPNKLFVNVANSGSEFANISWLYVINTSDNLVVLDTEISIAIAPGTTQNIATNLPNILLETGKSYLIKAVSSLGTVLRSTITPSGAGDADCDTKFFSTNREIASGERVRLILVVTNKGTDTLTNLAATTPTITPPVTLSGSVTPLQAGVTVLRAGESTIFMWEATIVGNVGQVITASGTVTGDSTTGGATCLPSTTVKISSETQDQIVSERRLNEVKIFLLLPGPNGASGSSEGVYGVIVANPLDTSITVRRVVLTFYVPTDSSNNRVFPNAAEPTGISPTIDADWSMPTANTIVWRGSSPYSVAARSAAAFLVGVEGGGTNADMNSINVVATVFSEMGEFANSGYSINEAASASSVPNVYLSTTVDSKTFTEIRATRLATSSLNQETFNVVFADMDSSGTTTISPGAELSILVPSGFTVNDVTLSTGFTLIGKPGHFTSTGDPVTFLNDGATLIRGITTSTTFIGSSATPARTITFTATPPTTEDTRIYIMFISADGTVSGSSMPVGAIAEIPIQVCKPATPLVCSPP